MNLMECALVINNGSELAAFRERIPEFSENARAFGGFISGGARSGVRECVFRVLSAVKFRESDADHLLLLVSQ